MATGRVVPPPDLEIRIKVVQSAGTTQLTYILHSPNAVAPFTHHEIAGPELVGSPEHQARTLLRKIEALGIHHDVGGELLVGGEIRRKLEGIGQDLWRDLFPSELRQAYRRFRESVQSLLLVSNEPWIGWEMVKPFETEGGKVTLDDPFLAERFELTRWLAGPHSFPGSLDVHAIGFIRGKDELPDSGQEIGIVRQLAASHPGLQDWTPAAPSVDDVVSLLEKGGLGLFHFAQHGTFDPSMANEAGLPLVDNSVFRPSDLVGRVQAQVALDKPLVVLNSCDSGRQGWSWTGLGGWADRWVRVCGCGAFVGTLWQVRDSAALAFAKEFYNSLTHGETLGRATLAARQAARAATPGDPSWLAYTVYGHPNALATFGEGAPEADPAEQPSIHPTTRREPNHLATSPLLTNAPPAPDIFVGRAADLDRLKERLGLAADRTQKPEMQVITAVRGWPGVGKTSIAAVLAHDPDLSARFEGTLWAAVGKDPDLLGILAAWGRWLGSEDLYRAGSLKEALSLLQFLLRDRRLVLVLDDLWEAAHAAPFQSARGPECPILVTTRETGIAKTLAPGPQAVHLLDVLDEDASFALLKKLAPTVAERYPTECRRLANTLGHLPLALHVAGRQLQTESDLDWGIADLLRELEGGRTLLQSSAPLDRADPTTTTLPTVSALFQYSVDRLDSETRERFRLLGGFVAKPATFGLDVLRELWETEDPRPTLRELTQRGLLESMGNGRFQIHTLLLRHAESLSPPT